MSREIPPMPLVTNLRVRPQRGSAHFPCAEAAGSFWYNGRAAIWQALRLLGLKPGARAVVPAYCCGSELDVLLKAGLTPVFYRVHPHLAADLDHIRVLCREPVELLYVIHYFGFSQPMDSIRDIAREFGLTIIEDNAHGLYSSDPKGRLLGTIGDAGIFSFIKTLPLPDGGGLLMNHGRSAPAKSVGRSPSPVAVAGKMKFLFEQAARVRYPATTVRVKSLLLDPLVSLTKRAVAEGAALGEDPHSYSVRAKFKLERGEWRMSGLARQLLSRAEPDAVLASRRRNYQTLLTHIEPNGHASPFLPTLHQGCCPLFFPLRVAERGLLQKHLMADHIGCRQIWSDRHEALPRDFPFEEDLRSTLLVLPVHQDLGEDEMIRMARAVNTWNNEMA
jgi:perosamine synthetase